MPLSPIAEAILQPIAEILLQLFGYVTARLLVPVFTFGAVFVEPGQIRETVKPGRGRIQRQPNGSLLMDAELGSLLGIIFWIVVGISIFVYFRA